MATGISEAEMGDSTLGYHAGYHGEICGVVYYRAWKKRQYTHIYAKVLQKF